MTANSAHRRPEAETRPWRCGVPMLRPTLLAVAVLLGWVWCSSSGRGTTPATVDTVAELSARLAAQPAQWIGREIRLRAVAVTLPLWGMPGRALTRRMETRLADARGAGSLPVILGPQDWLRAALRGLPVVGVVIPPPQAFVWGQPTMYRVRLVALRSPSNVTYAAVLLDAGPQDT